MQAWASASDVNQLAFRSSSLSRALNDSMS
jgi:hypothetical protein